MRNRLFCCTLAIVGALELAPPSAHAQEEGAKVTANQITQAKFFAEPLLWIGNQVPPQAELQALLDIIENARALGGSNTMARFEDYILRDPNSPWVPSLRANLAVIYRGLGRYSLALPHFEAAWQATKDAQSGKDKRVADFTLANWTTLLSSLGRVEKLEEILDSVGNRNLDNL